MFDNKIIAPKKRGCKDRKKNLDSKRFPERLRDYSPEAWSRLAR